jgi:hypothetical protein
MRMTAAEAWPRTASRGAVKVAERKIGGTADS